MKEPIPSPFSPTPIEDEVYIGIQKLCEELGIDRFHFIYVQNDDIGSTWKATTNLMDKDMADKLEEAADAMRENLEDHDKEN